MLQFSYLPNDCAAAYPSIFGLSLSLMCEGFIASCMYIPEPLLPDGTVIGMVMYYIIL